MAGQTTGLGRINFFQRRPHPLPWIASALLPLSSAVLFALAHPSRFMPSGLGFLGFIALLPFFISLYEGRARGAMLKGALFGGAAYALFNEWAFAFHPLAAPLIILLHAFWMSLLAPLIARMLRHRSALAWLGPAAAWTAFEWLKSSGWAGYPYGVLGYSQYAFPALCRSAGLWGVWGPSFLLASISAWLALWSLSLRNKKPPLPRRSLYLGGSILGAGILALILLGFLAPGFWTGWRGARASDGSNRGSSLSVLVIQPAFPARREGILPGPFYADRLLDMTEAGLKAYPDTELVVMPETAFPAALGIRLSYPPADDTDYAARRLLSSLGDTGLPVILGNARADYGIIPGGKMGRRNYNSALFLESGRIWSHYDKRRLVPLIEDFPSPPLPLSWREAADASWGPLWTAGDELSSFLVDGLHFSTPICYEDCFGKDCRELAKGVDVLISLASDTWAHSEAARMQHLSCAAYRPMETGRPLLRVTNDGVSALIQPDGSIDRLLPSIREGYARAEIRAGGGRSSPYLRFGDWLPALACLFAMLSLGLSFMKPLLKRQ